MERPRRHDTTHMHAVQISLDSWPPKPQEALTRPTCCRSVAAAAEARGGDCWSTGGFRSKAAGLLLVGKTLWRSATLRLTEYFSSGDGRFAVVLDPFIFPSLDLTEPPSEKRRVLDNFCTSTDGRKGQHFCPRWQWHAWREKSTSVSDTSTRREHR